MCLPWVLGGQGLGWVPHGSGTQYSVQTCFMVLSWSGAWEAELSTWPQGMGNTNGHDGEPGTPPQRLAEGGGCLPWSPRSCPPPLQAAAPNPAPTQELPPSSWSGEGQVGPFPMPDTLCLRAFACAVFVACNVFLPDIYTVHFLGLGLGPYLKQTNMHTNKPSCLASLFY